MTRLTWLLKLLLMAGLILILNYPLAFAVSHDITSHSTTLIVTILVISLLYGLSALSGPHHFHSLLIGLLAGNLIAFLTWLSSFRDQLFHFSDPDKLSTLFSFGVFIPALTQFYLAIRKDKSETAKLHIIITTFVTIMYVGYLVYRLLHRLFHDSANYNFFHFSLGICVGLITAGIIHLILSHHLLVFEKLSLYLKVMIKPITAFFMGYLLIMFIFTGLYTLFYLLDPTNFTILKNDRFGDLLFYSFSTITGMGFSIIEPEKPIAFILTTAENFLGLIWITVVFAATIAYMQAPFRQISEQLKKSNQDKL